MQEERKRVWSLWRREIDAGSVLSGLWERSRWVSVECRERMAGGKVVRDAWWIFRVLVPV